MARLTLDDCPRLILHGTFSKNQDNIIAVGLLAGGISGQKRRNHVHCYFVFGSGEGVGALGPLVWGVHRASLYHLFMLGLPALGLAILTFLASCKF